MDTGVHVTRQPNVGAQVYPLEGQMVQPTPTMVFRDRVHWGSVWAGMLTAFALFMIVEMFLYWVGAMSATIEPGGVITGGPANGWITGIIGIAAFFVGGWIASSNSIFRRPGSAGWVNGIMVWSLGITLILALSALGSGVVFGAAGSAFSQLMVSGRGFVGTGVGPSAAPQHLIYMSRDTAGWSCLFLVLSGIAAALGGMMGHMTFVHRDTIANPNPMP